MSKNPALDSELAAGKALAEHLMNGLRDPDGRVRVEDLIAGTATIVGEQCIGAAGDIDPRQHSLVPGSRVLSDAVNELLVGNVTSDRWGDYPLTSVCGALKMILTTKGGYAESDLCSMPELFAGFASKVAQGGADATSEWGKVPLSIDAAHHPRFLPLRLAFETRGLVDQIFAAFGTDVNKRLMASTFALAHVLIWVADAIDRKLAVRLAMEMVNGMSKTAPMTLEALERASKDKDV